MSSICHRDEIVGASQVCTSTARSSPRGAVAPTDTQRHVNVTLVLKTYKDAAEVSACPLYSPYKRLRRLWPWGNVWERSLTWCWRQELQNNMTDTSFNWFTLFVSCKLYHTNWLTQTDWPSTKILRWFKSGRSRILVTRLTQFQSQKSFHANWFTQGTWHELIHTMWFVQKWLAWVDSHKVDHANWFM